MHRSHPDYRVVMLVEGGAVPSNPSADSYSGSVRYYTGVIEVLQRHDVGVIFGSVRERTPIHEHVEALGCQTFSLDAGGVGTYPRAARDLSRLIKRWRYPEILHLHESIPGTIGGLSGSLVGHKRRIFHRHHSDLKGPSRLFSKFASRLSDRLIAVSQDAADMAIRLDNVSRRKIAVVHNGIRSPSVDPYQERMRVRSELDIPESAFVVLLLGHLRHEKGHRTLFNSIDVMGSARPAGLTVLVVGDGPERVELERLSERCPCRTIFTGHQKDVWPYLFSSDVLVIPSIAESFGLPAIEGAAAGVPVIASRVGGLSEIIEEGLTGLLFHPGDASALSQKILEVFDKPARRVALARAARERFDTRFTHERMAQGWMDCYTKLLGEGP